MKHNREEYNKHIQTLIKMMQDDYPNDFILEINSFGAEIRSTLTTMVFTDEELSLKDKAKSLFTQKDIDNCWERFNKCICNRCAHQEILGDVVVCMKNGRDKAFIPPDILTECENFKSKDT